MTEVPELFVHSKRRDWGLAILAWEDATKRGYQFEDGKLRTIKKGWYDLLEPVDRPLDIARQVARQLGRDLQVSQARSEVVQEARDKGVSLISLKDQVKVFSKLYPGGFQDAAYLANVRGEGTRRKAHRDPAIIDAQTELALDKLAPMVEAGEYEEVRQAAIRVMRGTDLASPSKDIKFVEELSASGVEAYAKGLLALLEGESTDPSRLKLWYKALAGGSWQLLTGLPALIKPSDEVPVKLSVFRSQAKWMAPTLSLQSKPSADLYQRALGMAFQVRRRVEQAGLEPQDLFDIYHFIWETLRPKAKELYGD